MKAVLLAVQPYYVFLIIARVMGWNIPQEKTVEVRKTCPRDEDWNKTTHIYCGKNRKSFNRIPVEYQPLMKRFLGKVIGEFVCDRIEEFTVGSLRCDDIERLACLSCKEMLDYFYKPEELDGKTGKFGYAWHISDLKIYDEPKELSEFGKAYPIKCCKDILIIDCTGCGSEFTCRKRYVKRPPQSYCYVEEV